MPDDDQFTAPQESPAEPPAAPVVTRTTRSRSRKATTAPAEAVTASPAEQATDVPDVPDVVDTPDAPVVKTTTRKAAAKKTTAKKAPAKKAPAKKAATKKTAAKKTAAPEPAEADAESVSDTATEPAAVPAAAEPVAEAPVDAPTVTTRSRRTSKKAAAAPVEEAPAAEAAPATESPENADEASAATGTMPLFQAPVKTTTTRRTRKTAAQRAAEAAEAAETADAAEVAPAPTEDEAEAPAAKKTATKRAPRRRAASAAPVEPVAEDEDDEAVVPAPTDDTDGDGVTDSTDTDDSAEDSTDEGADEDDQSGEGGGRRRRRRGGRRRRKSGDGAESGDDAGTGEPKGSADSDAADDAEGSDSADSSDDTDSSEDGEGGGEGSSRRRRRRRRTGEPSGEGDDDRSGSTSTRVRKPRNAEDEITSVQGSTRLEAKKQRRREGREAGRRRAPIVSEAEFLARRESVERVMVVRQREELTQIGVLEDKVLVEHYVARESQTSLIGNVYLGRVQNVLPSMEAAFIDIGKGRNAVLYAGEVNWAALGHKDGQPRKIESVLTSGQTILVQVSKDPVGHKGARLTSQISLAGRFLVYVPDGTTSGISRKLPDTERNRLKTLLKEIVPETAGVIVRTAAEGASEDELTSDVERLKARWEDIESKASGTAPQLLYGEPDLTLKVVRDLFTEDFAKLVIQGPDAWDTVQNYVRHVAPDLEERLERYEPSEHTGKDLFATYRIDEQIAKGLDRKVWLPSGGSLIIDRTEAMTVVDVNTGKFTGSGGNLEETVTKNNLEAAEEMVRQLRLRDIGGIIVIDFIDMVLESNRDLVLRRLVECLGRDRTRHQVAEVTSLGLVQMTRKRIGTGLVEAFSESCSHCQGRGVVISDQPVEAKGGVSGVDEDPRRGGGNGGNGGSRRGRGRGRGNDEQDGGHEHQAGNGAGNGGNGRGSAPSPAIVATMVRPENAALPPVDGLGPVDDAEPVLEPAVEPVLDTAAVLPDTVEDAAPSTTDEPAPDVAPEPAPDVAPELASVLDSVRSSESSAPVRAPGAPADTAAPVETAAAAPAGVTEPAEPTDEQGAGFPEPEPAGEPEQVGEPEQPGQPGQPKVVTRSRRRSASRPAGPPEGSVTPSSVTVDPTEVGEPVESAGEAPVVEHVPVKRRSSRRR